MMVGRRFHFIAIGGAGMSGLALVCSHLGAQVTGSDRAESSYMERLRAAGLEPHLGHDAELVPPDAEVVISTAIADDNLELARARERGQPVIHRGELLAELCAERRLLAIAGTHGKTTTAAMCIWALRATGADPTFFLGGELPGAGEDGSPVNASWGNGEWAIAEADESDASFLRLQPEVAVITNLELDHHSRWSSLSDARGLRRVRLPILGANHRGGRQAARPGGAEGSSLCARARQGGVSRRRADRLPDRSRRGRGKQVPSPRGRDRHRRRASRSGPPQRRQCLAALGGLALAGFDSAECAGALSEFPGVARRLEPKGERNGARIYDDYAHHPTEVSATLEAARELGPDRLIAVFQPHLYSRTKALSSELGAAPSAADEVAVLDVYPACEESVGPLAGVSGLMVADAAADRARGKPDLVASQRRRAAHALGPRLGAGDLLITIGAGTSSSSPRRWSTEGSSERTARRRGELPAGAADDRQGWRAGRLLGEAPV